MRSLIGPGLLLVVLSAVACGEEDRPPVGSIGSSAGRGGSGNRGGADNRGGEGGGGGDNGQPANPLAPVVEVLTPEPLESPSEGELLTEDEVDVTCRVTKSAEPDAASVDSSSVRIEVLDAKGSVVRDAAGVPNGEDEYLATVLISDVPNGRVSFRCSAGDTSDPPLVGSSARSTFVDHGPSINVIAPLPEAKESALGEVAVEFRVAPAPVVEGDAQAQVDAVSLKVAGFAFEVTADPDDAELYRAFVDFSDLALFPVTPSGPVPVTIRASNKREPEPVEAMSSYEFTVDGAGPTVSITSHDDEDVIGGSVVLGFSVTDALSGVDPESVVVRFGNVEHRYDGSVNWTHDGNNYTFRFDAREVEGAVSQVTINVLATDTAGVKSLGDSVTVWLDNYPPTIDLDPGPVRERKIVGDDVYCSNDFDPVGHEAANDLAVVDAFALFRAIVWDETNAAPGQTVFHLAGPDAASVRMYFQPDTATPMLIDSDEDGICDDVDAELELQFRTMKPVQTTGSSWFGSDSVGAPALSGCTMQNAVSEPAHLCTGQTSDLTRVVKHTQPNNPNDSVIYALGSLGSGLECTGAEVEVAGFANAEGWMCIAVVASDDRANRSVSAPLRVCYDNSGIPGSPACATDPGSAPSCTAGCAPAAGFGPAILQLF